MADKIYLHIGAPKTGTSYLQLMLWQHRDSFESAGFFLPLDGRRKQFAAVGDLRGGMWRTNPAAGASVTWQDLVDHTSGRDGTALVSEELLCATPTNQIKHAVASFGPTPVHIILGVRDLVRQIPAEWQQSVRARSAMEYRSWVQRLIEDDDAAFWRVQDPNRVLARWAEVVPQQNLHLITVPASGADPRALWGRFCSVLGVEPDLFRGAPTSHNASLGVTETELLRRVNAGLGDRFPLRQPYDHAVRHGFTSRVLRERPASDRIGFPVELLDWAQERSLRVVAEIQQAGYDVVGDLDDLLPPPAVPPGMSPEQVSTQELLDLAVESIIALLEDTSSARRRVRKLQKELGSRPPLPLASNKKQFFGRLTRKLSRYESDPSG